MLKIHLEKHLNFDNKIYVAFSGGSDSSALLYLTSDLRDEYELNIEAIHINHNLSQFSNDWKVFCRDLCKNANIEFKSIDLNIINSSNIEENARKRRYNSLKSDL